MPFILHFIDDEIIYTQRHCGVRSAKMGEKKSRKQKTNKSEAVKNTDSFTSIVNSTQAKR